MQRIKTFLVVCLSILMVVARSQSGAPVPVEKFLPDHLSLSKTSLVSELGGSVTVALTVLPKPMPHPTGTLPPFQMLDMETFYPGVEAANIPGGNYYVSHLGFFCKRELDVQKTIRLPVFFRLGSLEYCNKLEGK